MTLLETNNQSIRNQLVRPEVFVKPVAKSALKLLFGSNGDTMSATLPSWTKEVPDPKLNRAEVEKRLKAYKEKLEKKSNKKGSKDDEKPKSLLSYTAFKSIFYTIWLNFKLMREMKHANKLLPAEVGPRMRKYKWFSWQGWKDYFTDRPKYKRTLVSLEGPMAIKAKQSWVETQRSNYAMYQLGLKALSDKELRSKLREDMPAQARLFAPLIFFVGKRLLSHLIKTIETYMPLQNKVPFLPRAEFEPKLKALKEDYNKAHSSDPIVEIGDPIASGSMNQIFAAKTKSGQKLVVKVTRPDTNSQFLNDCKKYGYYTQLIQSGTDIVYKRKAAAEVDSHVAFLLQEANLSHEHGNAQKLNQARQALGISSFEVVRPLYANGQGMVMNWIEGTDLVDVKDPKQIDKFYASGAVQDISRLLLVAPTKPLDMHGGNFRLGKTGTPFWLDHGRQANLNPEVHTALLKLTTVLYRDLGDKYGTVSLDNLSLETLHAFRELVDLPGKTDNAWLTQVYEVIQLKSQIIALEEEKDTLGYMSQDQQRRAAIKTQLAKLQPELQEKQKPIVALLRHLLTPVSDSLHTLNEKTKKEAERATDQKAETSEDSLYHTSLFSIWANYELYRTKAANGFADLPKLSTEPISKADIQQYYEKYRGFARPMFWAPQQDDATLIQEIGARSPQDFVNAFNNYTRDLSPIAVGEEKQHLDEIARQVEYNPTDTTAADKLKTALTTLLKTDSRDRRNLLKVYRVNQSTKTFVKTMIADLNRETGLTQTPEQEQKLQQSLLKAIRDDFDLSYSWSYIENRTV